MKNIYLLLLFTLLLSSSQTYSQVPVLNSYSSAPAVLLLDFDGHNVTGTSWNENGDIMCAGANLSTQAITEIYNRIAEDYSPFNINVTTDETKYNAAPANRRTRALFTTTSSWYGSNSGGCALVGSFTFGDNTPCFIFTALLGSNVKNIAEVGAHEAGHTLSLNHQAKYDAVCNKTGEYNYGSGTGVIGWAPIMGVGYNQNTTTWFNGPNSFGCDNLQSDADIIANSTNGFGFRQDDAGESFQSAVAQTFSNRRFEKQGLITNLTDKDIFKFTIDTRQQVILQADPASVGPNDAGSNLDIQIQLFNNAQTLVNTYNPPLIMRAGMDTVLDPGTYYFSIEGASNEFTPDYGSLGSYKVTVEKSLADVIKVPELVPTFSMELQGSREGNVHKLSWTMQSSETILSQLLEVSTEGANYINLASPGITVRTYSYQTNASNLHYRLTVTVESGKSQTSNIVHIRKSGGGNTKKPHLNNTVITNNHLVLNSPLKYNYIITDNNGRSMYKGNISEGTTSMSINKLRNGAYFIHFTNENDHFVEKFVKQ